MDFANLGDAMHKSKLAGFIIDCQTADLDGAADFWGSALGMQVRALPPGEGEIYKKLEDSKHGLAIEVQRVSHPSRVHLDIETDDIEAEASRLEKLGAKRINLVRGRWWVMEAPSGHHFCVVRQQREPFGPHLNTWD